MTLMDDLDTHVRGQIVGGIDVSLAAKKVQEESHAPSKAEDVEAEMIQLSKQMSYSTQASKIVDSLASKKGLKQLLATMHNPPSDIEYYVLMKLLSLSLNDQSVATLFDQWISINRLPSFTNVMTWHYVDYVVKTLSRDQLKSSNLKEFNEKIDHLVSMDSEDGNPLFRRLLRSVFMFKTFEDSSQDNLRHIGREFTDICIKHLMKLKFPSAKQHNASVDLIATICIYLEKEFGAYFDGYGISQKALFVSYHSLLIIKLWCKCAVLTNKDKEVIPVFKTYVSYMNDTMVKHNNVRADPVDAIDTYLMVLKYVINSWDTPGIDEFQQVVAWISDLKDIIEDFLERTSKCVDLYTSFLRKFMSCIWYRLGYIYEQLCLFYTYKEGALDARIDAACGYYKQAIDLITSLDDKDENFADYYFHCAILTAKQLNYEAAIDYLKQGLKLQPNSLRYLNMIALLYSASNEDSDRPLTIALEVMDALKADKLSNEDTISSLSFKERSDILQMYMTVVALIEDSGDTFEALDALQELFELTHKLLKLPSASAGSANASVAYSNDPTVLHSIDESVDRRSGCDGRLTRVFSGKKPVSKAPMQDFNKEGPTVGNTEKSGVKNKVFDRIKTRSLGHRLYKLHGTFQRYPGSYQRKLSRKSVDTASSVSSVGLSKERRAMHDIWLWASKLFEKCGQLEDAEGCVDEAEAIYQVSALSCATRGQLLMSKDPKLALKLIEQSFSLQPRNNLEATIGLSRLTVTDSYKDAFISEGDRRSAIGRCKNKLSLLVVNYRYSTMSELFYYMSQLYELYNDKPYMEKALWRTVELENHRPARSIEQLFEPL